MLAVVEGDEDTFMRAVQPPESQVHQVRISNTVDNAEVAAWCGDFAAFAAEMRRMSKKRLRELSAPLIVEAGFRELFAGDPEKVRAVAASMLSRDPEAEHLLGFLDETDLQEVRKMSRTVRTESRG